MRGMTFDGEVGGVKATLSLENEGIEIALDRHGSLSFDKRETAYAYLLGFEKGRREAADVKPTAFETAMEMARAREAEKMERRRKRDD